MPTLFTTHTLSAKAKKHQLPVNYGQGRGGRPWRRKVERIKARDQYTCQDCGLSTHELEVDHKTPRAQGGSDDDSNLQSLCIPCHEEKSKREASIKRNHEQGNSQNSKDQLEKIEQRLYALA